MKDYVARYDLTRCYNFSKYNEAMKYANQKNEVEGMREQIEKMISGKDTYVQDIQNIIEPEKAAEEETYLAWEKWYKRNAKMGWGLIALIVFNLITTIFGGFGSNVIFFLGFLGWIISPIALIVFIIMKVGTKIKCNAYNKLVDGLYVRIESRNKMFLQQSQEYYEEIDNLYLISLDPTHREMVLMRREQAEFQKQMQKLEKERLRLERDRQTHERETLEENRRARAAQERLLAIEEEREKRWR